MAASKRIVRRYFLEGSKYHWSTKKKASWMEIYTISVELTTSISKITKSYPKVINLIRKGYLKKIGPSELQNVLREYNYDVNNVFYRAYSYLEKILQLINTFCDLGLDTEQVKKHIILGNSHVGKKVVRLIENFYNDESVRYILSQRKIITHRIKSYPKHIRKMNSMYIFHYQIDRKFSLKDIIDERKAQYKHIKSFGKKYLNHNDRVLKLLNTH